MALNRKLISLGVTVAFVVDGTSITNGEDPTTSSAAVKPDGTTPSDWASLARSSELTVESVFDEEPVMAPAPGAYRRVDIFRSMMALDLTFVGIDFNELAFQSIFQSAPITDSTPFVPQAKLGQVYGWMKIEGKSQRDAAALDCELYGILSVKNFKADGKRILPEFNFAMLYNTLNTGTSKLASA